MSFKSKITYNPNMTLYDLEKAYILEALEYYEGNRTQAAAALGITIKTLYNKMHEFELFEKFSVKDSRGQR